MNRTPPPGGAIWEGAPLPRGAPGAPCLNPRRRQGRPRAPLAAAIPSSFKTMLLRSRKRLICPRSLATRYPAWTAGNRNRGGARQRLRPMLNRGRQPTLAYTEDLCGVTLPELPPRACGQIVGSGPTTTAAGALPVHFDGPPPRGQKPNAIKNNNRAERRARQVVGGIRPAAAPGDAGSNGVQPRSRSRSPARAAAHSTQWRRHED